MPTNAMLFNRTLAGPRDDESAVHIWEIEGVWVCRMYDGIPDEVARELRVLLERLNGITPSPSRPQ